MQMEDGVKPFVCPVSSCGRSFANEDHWTRHKIMHRPGSLGLRDIQGSQNVNFADETPTPTRFLQSCDEVGLFSDNPFDEEFRQASQRGATPSLNVDEPLGPLNTPSLPSDVSDEPLTTAPHLNDDDGPLSKVTEKSVSDDPGDSMPFDANLQVSLVEEDGPEEGLPTVPNSQPTQITETSFLHQVPPAVTTVVTLPATSVIQTSVITSAKKGLTTNANTITSSTGSVLVGAAQNPVIIQPVIPSVAAPIKVPAKSNNAAATTLVLPAASFVPAQSPQVYQLFVTKLPDGQQISLAPTVAVAPAVITKNGIQPSQQQQPSAKMKLKETLLQGKVTSNDVEVIKAAQIPVPIPVTETAATTSTTSRFQGSRRRQRDESDPDEKRKKLERNCAAAKRCRQKKKAQMQTLKQKVEKLEAENAALKSEVSKLRNQVAELKTILLAHKDCPKMMEQQSAVRQATNGLLSSAEVDIPCGPDGSMASESNITIFSALDQSSNASPCEASVIEEETILPTVSVQLEVTSSENENGEVNLDSKDSIRMISG